MGPALAIVLATLCAEAKPPPWLPPPPKPPVDVSDRAVYRLRPEGEGYIYDDQRFQARIARDGVVSFKDKRFNVSLPSLPGLDKGAKSVGPTLESTLRDLLGRGKRRKGAPAVEPPPPPPDPRKLVPAEVCPPHSPCYVMPLPNMVEVTGSFDLTDEIMRSRGRDPYAYEKARFLSSTFEMRIKMALAARKADLKASLASLPARLEELWADDRYTPRERRRILYELWWETDTTVEGARAAHAIEAFIRRRLPCGSPQGYAGEELESLRELHLDRHFLPTADCAPARPE